MASHWLIWFLNPFASDYPNSAILIVVSVPLPITTVAAVVVPVVPVMLMLAVEIASIDINPR
jgi:hypothetical protein